MKAKYQITPPADTPEYMWTAYYSALLAALKTDVIMQQFKDETCLSWCSPRNGLEAMIDEATGYQEQFVKKFVEWFNVNVWGPL